MTPGITIHEFRLTRLKEEVARKFVPDAEAVNRACIEAAEGVLDFMPGEEFVHSVEVKVGPRGGVYFQIATRNDHGPRKTHKGVSLQQYMADKAVREGTNSWLFRGLKEVFPGVRRDSTRITV